MFIKCLDCSAVVLDPEMNTYQCPICGSEHLAVLEQEKPDTYPRRWEWGAPFTQEMIESGSPQKALKAH